MKYINLLLIFSFCFNTSFAFFNDGQKLVDAYQKSKEMERIQFDYYHSIDTQLTSKEKNILLIAAYTAIGDVSSLSSEIQSCLNEGLSINEIKEVMVQMYAYAGFPRSLNALNVLMGVIKDRKKQGVNDYEGRLASHYPNNKSKIDFGTDNQTRLVGAPVKGEVYEFAPVIDQFLKEHLFGDIFGRDILDYRTREIATIGALASTRGVENQLRSHFRVGLNNGITKSQLIDIVEIIKSKIGSAEGDVASLVLMSILNTDKSNFTSKSQNSNFIGSVSVKMVVSPDSVFNTQMAYVTFDAGARTNWHNHPSGQILYVTEGTAFYQERGKSKKILERGDMVKCPPKIDHWHGATPDGRMTHLALTPDLKNGSVVWLNPVSEEEYKAKN
jgi:alkylhydroperoxidase/carboxymuconolactone decarboxylase family protein YurZ/quercetin dioxygenase-like cupin family protein